MVPKQKPLPLDLPAVEVAPATPRLPTGYRAPHALWLAIHRAALPLEVFAAPDDAPFAVVEGESGKVAVVAANAAALRCGVHVGLPLSAALALAPTLGTRAREPALERAALERLAAWATQFTPEVTLVDPDAVLLEVRGSLALFGGYDALRARCAAGLRAFGQRATLAAAPTPRAAEWLARAGIASVVTGHDALAGALGALPLTALDWDGALLERLEGIGVRRVVDVLRLPRADFARRYGQAPLRALDEALARRADPRPPYAPPPRFEACLPLLHESAASATLVAGMTRLVAELAALLRARGLAVQGFTLELRHRDQPPSACSVGLRAPSRDAARLAGLAREKLERLVLPAPVRAIALCAERLVPLPDRDAVLFEDRACGDEAFAALVERLAARLGTPRVRGLACVADHRPERAWTAGVPGLGDAVRIGAPRPTWLLRTPQPLALVGGRPWLAGPFEILAGPERIESGWWDGEDVTRDYYLARSADRRRAWMFRDRRPPGGWFLHGWFG